MILEILRQRALANIVPLAVWERMAVVRAMRQTRGNLSLAAQGLGISRATLYRMLSDLCIRPEDYQGGC